MYNKAGFHRSATKGRENQNLDIDKYVDDGPRRDLSNPTISALAPSWLRSDRAVKVGLGGCAKTPMTVGGRIEALDIYAISIYPKFIGERSKPASTAN